MSWRPAQDGDLAAIRDLLRRNVASSMFLLINLRDHGLHGTEAKAMRVWVRGSGNSGVAGLTNDGTLLIQAAEASAADWQQLQQLVEQRLAETSSQPQVGVLGETTQARRYLAATGLDQHPKRLDRDEPGLALSLTDLDLSSLDRPQLKGATLHPLSAAPRPMLVQWRAAYHQEILGTPASEAVAIASQDIDSYLLRDSHRVLSIADRWVAMTGFNAQLPEVVQIGGVYTPPEQRGHGYARCALALHLKEARRAGVEQAVLFAAGEAAVRAYRAIGFQPIGGYSLILFDHAPQPELAGGGSAS
ncbi:GNAT family N-acetyltransferase [Phaeobacter gallaeciensis]|uniref:Acetyltransferase n=1 Tax=Phaeobacter gallaeciensis TaxID=60890 RepID=A0AAC9ZBV0_9RHOB|nr:GNAT family N-acetyltransferase [Phaeobacter gallaeciensis]AHD10938.1 putative acetyltransferase [Phaeobacter gallaeciensis DSM 26640]ATE94201.1 putative acetyltransferase [Phaeobacter gallaeciensis]ATE95978.1 putative acetyltransferase [Phaeobacter gallaeciensis]ATF02865.1 putative acetyltransferase [Phaeobacter gallaeciensis]ATF07245.1 putative acetyltransferase [Phaeobacter gallaeciensis]